MEVEFDPEKSARNEAERGLPFERAADLDWSRALVAVDDRRDYGETRYVALVPLDGRLHFVCYVGTADPDTRRIISFRKANQKEERHYEQATHDRR